MKVKEVFDKAIKVGVENDPRDKGGVERALAIEKRKYDKIGKSAKQDFDEERLTNPFHDTRVLNEEGNPDVKRVMVGIDLEVQELVLADRIGDKDEKIDLCITHHPQGYARTGLWRIMEMQADIMNRLGIPINVAEGILDPRKHKVKRGILVQNHTRTVDAAKLLEMPYMCIHTPADNCVSTYLQSLFDKNKPDTVGEVMDVIEEIPEYEGVKKYETGLMLFTRSVKSVTDPHQIRAGEVFVDMTGGTGGSKYLFEKLITNTNVGTIVGMHISEENLNYAKKNHVNVLIAGHIASDSLGMNLL
ncbi:MAG: NGG1p interacting factor NIF3, partial [bacterium]|nr:NGG1p interacting factor NIF3 [bacterium]